MNTINRHKLILIVLVSVFQISVFAQNMNRMVIDKIAPIVVVPQECVPGGLIIVINSSIPNLRFESNILPDSEFTVVYSRQTNQYIICHERTRFILTISGTNLESENIEFFDLSNTFFAYRITANTAKGIVNILTNPRNATVIFPDLNNLTLSSNKGITNVEGIYRVKIVKANYSAVDTVVQIPRDAEKTYEIDLIPEFSRIQLNLSTDDDAPFTKAPVITIDNVNIELEALVKGKDGTNQRSFFDGVEFLKFYEGNIIPLLEGTHSIRIEAESYNPYENILITKNGELTPLKVSLEPIFGYITFADKQFSEGATIFVNDKVIGKVPLFQVKARVGNHKIRYEKPGFISEEKEYKVKVMEKQVTSCDVYMRVAKKISFVTDPINADVLIDSTLVGFTPLTTIINAGNHKILIRKTGFASELLTRTVTERSIDNDSVKLKLHLVDELLIRSEEKDLFVQMVGKGDLESVLIDKNLKTTDSTLSTLLPYGKYKIVLTKSPKKATNSKENKVKQGNLKNVVYKSTINHSPGLKQPKLPNYSKNSFHTLTASFESKNSFEASFGRIHIFPGSGLSTSIINFDYKVIPMLKDTINYNFKTLASNIIFLNWDWRLGGSIIRQIDVNLLARAKFTPGLNLVSLNIPSFTDVEMQNYFYGFEISTRFSYVNFCFRYGQQINIGRVNYWDEPTKKYTNADFPINDRRNVATIGVTVNGIVSKSNNMLRLWNKPLVDMWNSRATDKKSKNNQSESFFSKMKNIFKKSEKN